MKQSRPLSLFPRGPRAPKGSKGRGVTPIPHLILSEEQWQNSEAGGVDLLPVSWGLRKVPRDPHAARRRCSRSPESLHPHHVGRECTVPSGRGRNGCSGMFWGQDALHLKRKNKHLLREELKYCAHMVIMSSYF